MKRRFYSLLIMIGFAALTGCVENEVDDKVARLKTEVKQIDDYLAAQGVSNVLYDNTNGMRFTVESYGRGEVPENGQTVKVTFTGKLFSNGQVFQSGEIIDQFEDIDEPAGLRYALSALLGGSTATFYLPSSLAFGPTGSTSLGVPGNSIVVYNVTAFEVMKTATQLSRFETDTAAIHAFVTENNITDAIKDQSGIWYKVSQQGTGDFANPYSTVNFTYKLSLLSSPTTIIQQNTFTSSVFGLIDGLKIGFQTMQVGGKTTFYIPSGLGYGPTAQNSIPANSNLIFEITLNSID